MAAPKGPSLSFVCFCVVLHFCEVLAVKEVARTSGEGMSHGNFRRHPFHYLNLTGAAKTFFVHQTDDCALFCLRAVSCVSFNMAAYPDANSNFLCELLASDKYNASCMFLPHSYFHHYSVNVSWAGFLFLWNWKVFANYKIECRGYDLHLSSPWTQISVDNEHDRRCRVFYLS